MALTLRKKSLLIVTLTLVALIVGLYFGIRAIVLDSFSELEQDNVALHVDRVNAAIDNELVKMDLTLKDWSKPGQTVVYGRLIPALDDQRFSVTSEGKNGLADLFANLDLNLWVITESSGEVVWGWGYDENEEEITLVHSSFKDRLIPGSPLLSLGSGELRGMVIDESQDALLVVARRVDYLDREGQASPALAGAMIMGRYLDSAEVERLAGQTQLALAVYGLDEPRVPAEIRSQRSVLSETGATLVEPLDDDNVAGYTLLADVGGPPGRLLQVVVPRDIMDEGQGSLFWLLIALVAVGLALILLIGFLMDKLVLSRLARLSSDVRAVGSINDLKARVSASVRDELSNLGSSINGMLGGLEEAHEREQEYLAEIESEREKSDSLLLNVLPEEIAQRLKQGENTIADSFQGVSVLFADVVDFTRLSAAIAPEQVIGLLNEVFSAFDRLTEKHGLEKIKTIGDAYMMVGGLPTPREDHAEAIAEMALDMQEEIRKFNAQHGSSVQIRTGINSGPVVAGVIGTKKFIYDLWGDTVNTASRMESHGIEGSIQLTQATRELVRDKYELQERGVIEVKGKGLMTTYLLTGRKVPLGQEKAPAGAEG